MLRRTEWAAIATALAVGLGDASARAQSAASPDEPAIAVMAPDVAVGGWPKVGLDTAFAVEYAGLNARRGPDRDWGPSLRVDSALLVDVNESTQLSALFQVKPREPLSATDP